jgi:hypothetical protein
MASTTLTVTVSGGIPPVKIQVNFFKGQTLVSQSSSKNSFTRDFTNLGKGEYSLFIIGMNPLPSPAAPNPNTRCELTLDGITLHPPDNSPTVKKGKAYIAKFRFTV